MSDEINGKYLITIQNEVITDIVNINDLEKEMMVAILRGVSQGSAIHDYLGHKLTTCVDSSLEMYVITTDRQYGIGSVRSMFDANPDTSLNAIRTNGNCVYRTIDEKLSRQESANL